MKSFKQYVSEESPIQALRNLLGKKFNKNYAAAIQWMKKTGKTPADAARMFSGVDARTLATMTESIQMKINRNTYFMGKDVGPVYTHHSGYSIAKVGTKWIISNPDDEKAGEFKTLASAKSEVETLVN